MDEFGAVPSAAQDAAVEVLTFTSKALPPTIVAATGGTVTGSAVVTSLLSAAGATAAVPYAGWIAAAGLTTAAAIVGLVSFIKKTKAKGREAVILAQKLGFEDAAGVPNFTKKLFERGSAWRLREGERLEKLLMRPRGVGIFRKEWKLRLKLSLIGAVEALEQAEARRAAGLPPFPPSREQVIRLVQQRDAEIAAAQEQIQQERLIALLIVGVSVGVVAYSFR